MRAADNLDGPRFVQTPTARPEHPLATVSAAPTVNSAESETPLFFESAGRPLYGVYHPAAREREGGPVLVQCHGLGVEQISLYRVMVLNARAAAVDGYPVLR